jgi:hypothetical protein
LNRRAEKPIFPALRPAAGLSADQMRFIAMKIRRTISSPP